MNKDELVRTAKVMVTRGKGLLAADESSRTIARRFAAISVELTDDTRRNYRELLFRSEDAMKQYISGVILYDETIRQTAKDGMRQRPASKQKARPKRAGLSIEDCSAKGTLTCRSSILCHNRRRVEQVEVVVHARADRVEARVVVDVVETAPSH